MRPLARDGQAWRAVQPRRRAGDAADYGYCASHSRYFCGFRLHALFALDGTPRALALTSPKIDEKDVCLQLVARCERQPGQILTLIGDKNFRGKQFETDLAALDAPIHRPRRKDEPGSGPHLAPIRQRIESIFWTAKDILTLERHGARTLHGLRVRLACRFLALAAAVALQPPTRPPSQPTNRKLRTNVARTPSWRNFTITTSGPSPRFTGNPGRRSPLGGVLHPRNTSGIRNQRLRRRCPVLARRRRHPGLPGRNVTRRPTRSQRSAATSSMRARSQA